MQLLLLQVSGRLHQEGRRSASCLYRMCLYRRNHKIYAIVLKMHSSDAKFRYLVTLSIM